VTPEQRREAIERLLAEDPTASQRAIAEAVGCSQATVARDIAKLSGDSSVIHIDSQGVSQPDSQVGRGAALVTRLRAEMTEQGLIPTSGEEELLAVAWDLADRIELLQRLVAVDGERRKLKDGSVRLHPGLSEIRQCEATLARVVGGIQTMEMPPKNAVKQRAANSRWERKRMAEASHLREVEDGT
jgi:biotin operon repressor